MFLAECVKTTWQDEGPINSIVPNEVLTVDRFVKGANHIYVNLNNFL